MIKHCYSEIVPVGDSFRKIAKMTETLELENKRLRYELKKIADIQILDGRGRSRYQELLFVSVLTARRALEEVPNE